jgi:ribonuclease J
MTEKSNSAPNRTHRSGFKKRVGNSTYVKPVSTATQKSESTIGSTNNSIKKSSVNFKRRPAKYSGSKGRPVHTNRKPATYKVPPLADGDIRIIPICGVEWIGTNMTAIEYKNEIIVVDAGFGFSNPDTPGINYTIPDTTYLEQNKEKIKALVITHGHMDHVGGIPYVIEKLGMPKIYTREFGAMFMKTRMAEFPHVPKLDIVTIEEHDDYVQIGEHLKVKFFGLTHSIPDSTGIIIQTPHGGIMSTGDVRVENIDGVPVKEEVEQYKFFKDENILLCTMDSTGIVKPGWSASEEKVKENIDLIIKEAQGRLIVAAFSSQVERLIALIESTKKYGKKLIIEGRSMKNNLGIAKELKLTDFSHVIPVEEMGDYPANKIVMLITGGQGEQYSGLVRVAEGTHRKVKLTETDTIVLSASVIPGNEFAIGKLKDRLYKGSSNVITYRDNLVHASGHGAREELKWIHSQIPYKFFMPVHGYFHFLKLHAQMVEKELNFPKENIVVPEQNGTIVEIRENGTKLVKLKERVSAKFTVVDGNYVGPMHDAVIKDRMTLSSDGIFVVVVLINQRTKKLKKSPDIISRGFVYLKENQELLNETRDLVRKTVESSLEGQKNIEFDKLKEQISKTVGKFLVRKTDKEPVVIPVILTA